MKRSATPTALPFNRLVRYALLRTSRCLSAPGATVKVKSEEIAANPFVFTDLSSLSNQTFIL